MKQTKRCHRCGNYKLVHEFGRNKAQKDGIHIWCKDCVNEYARKYYNVREEYHRSYSKKNRGKLRKYQREYYHNNIDKMREYRRLYQMKRRRVDPVYRLKNTIRTSIIMSFHRRDKIKSSHCEEILGCSIEELVMHLRKTWLDEYGDEWSGQPCHIDHIVPLAVAKTKQEVIKLCHYTNLRLITPKDNIYKKDSMEYAINNNLIEKGGKWINES